MPPGGVAARAGAEDRHRRVVVVVMDDADQGQQIGALWERVAPHITAGRRDPAPESLGCPVGDLGQIEQAELQSRRPGRGLLKERALAAADVEQAAMAADVVGTQDFGRDERLRLGHESGIRGDVGGWQGGRIPAHSVGPVSGQASAAFAGAEQGDRVGEVAVEDGVMPDHRGDAVIADHGRAERAKAVIGPAPAQQLEPGGGLAQPLGALGGQAESRGQRGGRERAGVQDGEEVERDAGGKHLGIGEPGAQIEQCA